MFSHQKQIDLTDWVGNGLTMNKWNRRSCFIFKVPPKKQTLLDCIRFFFNKKSSIFCRRDSKLIEDYAPDNNSWVNHFSVWDLSSIWPPPSFPDPFFFPASPYPSIKVMNTSRVCGFPLRDHKHDQSTAVPLCQAISLKKYFFDVDFW